MQTWTVPRIYGGRTIYCVGSGPSLAKVDPRDFAGKPVVTCNSAVAWAKPVWGPKVHALFYSGMRMAAHDIDCDALRAVGGTVVTIDPAGISDGVRQLEARAARGLYSQPDGVAHGLTCGHGAINLAYHLGADRIVLIGYDMRVNRIGATHWDGRDVAQPWKYATHFARAFRQIAADLAAIGVSVLNATPHSALEAFPKISLADALH